MRPPKETKPVKVTWSHCEQCGELKSDKMLTPDMRFCKFQDCAKKWEKAKEKSNGDRFRGPGR